MTIQEAKEIIRTGKKITHKSFFIDEWVKEVDGKIIDEQGYEHPEFWTEREKNDYFKDGWKTVD